jgi:hypothetical protein
MTRIGSGKLFGFCPYIALLRWDLHFIISASIDEAGRLIRRTKDPAFYPKLETRDLAYES